MAHELAIVALDGCMAFAVADVLQVANGMVLRGGGLGPGGDSVRW